MSTESDGTVAVAEVRDRGLWVTPDRAEEQGRMGLALAHRVCDEVALGPDQGELAAGPATPPPAVIS